MVLVCDPVTVWRTVHCNPALTQWLLRLAPVSLRPWGGWSVGEQMDVFFFFVLTFPSVCVHFCGFLFQSPVSPGVFSLSNDNHLCFIRFSLLTDGRSGYTCLLLSPQLSARSGRWCWALPLFNSFSWFFFFLTPWLHTKRCFLSVCLSRRLDPLTTFEPISTDVWVQDGWVNPFAKNMFRFLLFGPTTLWHHINVHLRSEYTEGFFFFFILVKHNWWLVC